MRCRIGALSFAVAFLVFASAAFAGQTLYVDADAVGANNGSSWADAFNYLQDALSAAQSGDEIWVAEGIYEPDQGANQTPGDREATFQLINGVALMGGYAGFGAPDPNARDIELYETILSGDLNGDDADVADPEDLLNEPTRAENSYHVVTTVGTDNTSVLDGFTITGGNANGNSQQLYWGGGIYNENPATPDWECTTAGPTISNCRIVKNSSYGEGGGMYNRYSCQPQIINCDFIENMSLWGGGGIKNDTSNPIITNCIFRRNYAGDNDHSNGGGMDNEESSPTVTDCSFIGNSADYGGAISNWMGGCSPVLVNCLFYNNSAEYGGVMWISNFHEIGSGSHPKLINCTLAGNSAVYGSALACTRGFLGVIPSNVQLTNCILWDGGDEVWNDDSSTIIITYSDVEGGWSGPGGDNINVDPNFVDANNLDPNLRDYRLQPGSPCIDAGDPNYIPEPNETDLDGNPRVLDGDEDGEAIVDMGAYEFLPAIEADLRILPRVINRKSRGRYVMAIMRLPEGIAEEDIDTDEGFVLEPGNIESILWRTAVYDEQVRVFVLFEKARLMDAVSSNGEIELTVSGQLESGQGIYGVDTIRIIGPPGEHPRGHTRPRPQRRAGGRVR